MLKLLFCVLFIISGCTKKSTTTSTDENENLYPGDYSLKTDLPFEIESSEFFGSVDLTGYSFSLVGEPGFVSINSSTGKISGIPDEVGSFEGIQVVATSDDDQKTSQSFSIGVQGDPLRSYSWHLRNTAQTSFSETAGDEEQDMKVTQVWNEGVTGVGVRIVVSDTGVETTHEDLIDNMLDGEHKNYALENDDEESDLWLGDPEPTLDGHGTSVSGIIAATGWNNLGSNGIAPNAQIAGYQFIDSSQTIAISVDQASGDFDIFNYSYGDATYADQSSSSLYIEHLRNETATARGYLGSIFVKAAGNEFETCELAYMGVAYYCVPHNANLPLENEIPFLILVGAVNAQGIKSSYSNVGSNLWVSAPGGEYGDTDPAIITTDWSSCAKGMSKSSTSTNSFEYGSDLNSDCNYTSLMNGTSAATPMVSGVAALLLEANPNLSWRDVKHILAVTADKVDEDQGVTLHPTSALRLTGYNYELGWVTNDAGIPFNNWYGFGRVNAKAAYDMAVDDDYELIGPLVEINPDFDEVTLQRTGLAIAIPDANATGVTDVINVTTDNIVETIQIKISVTHPISGQVGIELTSPAGTKSILLNINNSLLMPTGVGDDPDANLSNLILTTNAFYGEDLLGNWTIKLIDGFTADTGTLTRWSINALTHAK